VDISVLAKHDAKTGIQRVSRSILSELLKSGVPGYRFPPSTTPGECYRYANQYLSSNFPGEYGADEPVLFSKDDILIATDLTAHLFPEVVTQIDSMRAAGRSPALWCMIFCHYDARSGVSKAFSVNSRSGCLASRSMPTG
jgi:hypothetical protein